MKVVFLLASALGEAGGAAAGLTTPARVTLDGVGGVRPGMSVAAVSAKWGVPLRPNYEVRPTCGTARIERPGIVGEAIFMPRGRFGAVFFRSGAVTGRGIRIGSTLAQLRRLPEAQLPAGQIHPRGPQLLPASRTRPALGAARRHRPAEAGDADRVRRARVRTSRRSVRLGSAAHSRSPGSRESCAGSIPAASTTRRCASRLRLTRAGRVARVRAPRGPRSRRPASRRRGRGRGR
jgi:hypothetical protein